MLKMIDSLLNFNRPKDISHKFFGVLRFSKKKYRNQCFWTGNIIFEGHPISLRIFSGKEAPVNSHVDFFNKTMNNLDLLVEESSKFVEHNFEIWTNKIYSKDFLDEFKCVNLDIPMEGEGKNDWQITFARRLDEDFVFTVYVVNNKVESTDLD